MTSIVVGRSLVLVRRSPEVLAFEKDFREQEISVGTVGLAGEEVQVLAVPLGGLLIIALAAVPLGLGMVVLRQVCQVVLEMLFHGRVLGARVAFPEQAVHAVTVDETLFSVQHQRRESAPLVGLYYLYLEQWRLAVIGIARDKGLIRLGRIDVALLLQIEIAQIHINDVAVIRVAAVIQKLIDAGCAVHVGKADAQHAKRVLDEFPVRPAEARQPVVALFEVEVGQLAIQQREERLQAVFVPGELELRPAQLVKRLLVEP